MRKSTLGLLTGLIFVFGQGAAQAAADQACLARDERESTSAYKERVHADCEARWSALSPAGAASDHKSYVKGCEQPCYDKLASGTSSTALLVGGLAVAAGAGAAAAGSKGGGTPASP